MTEQWIDYQQKRGAGWDVVDEAINTYDAWMQDDDYDALNILESIIDRMKERRDRYGKGASARGTP